MSEINPFRVYDYLAEARERVTEAFKDKVIFDKYLQLLLSENIQLQEVYRQLMQERSIDTAIGAQLDIIGEIVGQPRELFDTDLINYFAFDGYPSAESYGDLNDTSVGGYYYSFGAPLAGNTLLNDDQYRLFIKAKILKNTTSVTPNQLLEFIAFVFGVNENQISAEGGAEFTLMLGKELNSFEKALLTYVAYAADYPARFVPKPVGVRVNYGQFNAANVFGFQGAPGAKGYGDLVEDVVPSESLILDFAGDSYSVWETTYTLMGGGKYATLF